MNTAAHAPPVFSTPQWHARELDRSEMPRLQALFDANPEYFLGINGRPPRRDEAQLEFDELPPAHLSFGRRWFMGLHDRRQELVGVAVALSDFSVPAVWHLALFLVRTALHGTGAAQDIDAAMERWVERSGARWIRLGVVEGNARAERFWQRNGYLEVRRRLGVDTGGRMNNLRVLVKPLVDSPVDDYLASVARDHPGSTLP